MHRVRINVRIRFYQPGAVHRRAAGAGPRNPSETRRRRPMAAAEKGLRENGLIRVIIFKLPSVQQTACKERGRTGSRV